MAAIAHGWNPPGKDVPVKVAKEFNRADTGTKLLSQAMKSKALRKKGK